jgi:hypothetical protein
MHDFPSLATDGVSTAVVGHGISKGGRFVYMPPCELKFAVKVHGRFLVLDRELLKKKISIRKW